MRTTLNIDDDILAAASTLARAESVSVGKAISDLARRGLNAAPRTSGRRSVSGFPFFSVPQGARPIMPEDVRKADDGDEA